jgi:hypothetical protein
MNNYPLFLMSPAMRPLFVLLILVDLVLRGMALYKSARKGQTVWFVALFVVNSMGILPLIYLLIQNAAEKRGVNVSVSKAVKVATKTKKKAKK